MAKEFLKAAEYSILNMKLSDGRFVLHTARCEYEYYFYSIITLFTIRWLQLRGYNISLELISITHENF